MGAGINCWIEYDEHNTPPFSQEPDVLPLTDWRDLDGAKDYPVYGALSGIRNSTGIPPLFPLRGVPVNPSWQLTKYVGKYGTYLIGWLHPSEVKLALAHHNVPADLISLEMKCVLHTLDYFAATIGDDRVRFVFEIE